MRIEKALMLEVAKYNDADGECIPRILHRIRSVHTFMILMHSIVFIMRQRFWQKKMPENKKVILRFI